MLVFLCLTFLSLLLLVIVHKTFPSETELKIKEKNVEFFFLPSFLTWTELSLIETNELHTDAHTNKQTHIRIRKQQITTTKIKKNQALLNAGDDFI